MISVNTECTACTACAQACPRQAIKMLADEEGFVKPKVDVKACIQCGKCDRVCPLQQKQYSKQLNKAYYLMHKSEDVLRKSSSGGAFYAIARLILSQNGVVFGCVFDAASKRFIYKNTDQVPLEELMRSKYVESYIGDAFQQVKEQLDRGRLVAFCGTPCHVAGLKSFLGKKIYENLCLLDFACGGVPSQDQLIRHMEWLEKKYKSRITSVNFRDKRYGWRQYCLTVTFENGKEYSCIAELDAYLCTFLHTKTIKRESCAVCRFQEHHCADFVIADFWKVKSFRDVPENINLGISLVMCQTQKAQEMMLKLPDVEMGEILDIEAARYNFCNTHLTKEQQVQLISDRVYLRQHGLRRYYLKRFGLKHVLKYSVKQILLKVKQYGNS